MQAYRGWVLLIAALSLLSSRARATESDVLFGHNSAGQIKGLVEFDQPFILPVSIFPGISGFATGELGVHSTILDDPANDFFQFSSAATFQFILLAKDPGMEVWNDTGSAFLPVGGTFFVGQAPFDTHPIWNIPDNLETSAKSLTLKMHDVNGIYSDSDPVTLSFRPVPEPGTTLVVVAAMSLCLRLRRR